VWASKVEELSVGVVSAPVDVQLQGVARTVVQCMMGLPQLVQPWLQQARHEATPQVCDETVREMGYARR
jgi:hypothetical protein